MPRAATTSDAFNAIAEPGRRAILDLLGRGETSVGELVTTLGVSQPHVSKHLAVLRAVDLVRSRTVGRQHLYRVNGAALKTVHDWVSTFEGTWNRRLDRLDDVVAQIQAHTAPPTTEQEPPP